MNARALLAAVGAAAIAGALSSGAGAQSVTGTNGRVSLKGLRGIGAAVPGSPTPNLLQATPHGTPVDLHVDEALEGGLRKGEDLILNRDYDDALALFKGIGVSHRKSPLGPLGEMLVWQSRMLENGDFAHVAEYDAAVEAASQRLDEVKSPGAWDRLLEGGFYGVRAMHAMRQKRYLKAVNEGWTALSDMKSLKRSDPALADSDVGLGTYDYWRSVITHSVKWLPFFSDKRKQGILEIERSFVDSQYVRPIAQMVLIYIYIDERRYEDAINLGEDMAKRYPRNTLVRVQLGRAYTRRARYRDAIALYEEILVLQPDNKVADYYLGANLLYEGKDLDGAERHLAKFEAAAPGDDWRGWANERLGDVAMKRDDREKAIAFWKKALKYNPDDEGVKSKIAHPRPATPTPVDTPVVAPVSAN